MSSGDETIIFANDGEILLLLETNDDQSDQGYSDVDAPADEAVTSENSTHEPPANEDPANEPAPNEIIVQEDVAEETHENQTDSTIPHVGIDDASLDSEWLKSQ